MSKAVKYMNALGIYPGRKSETVYVPRKILGRLSQYVQANGISSTILKLSGGSKHCTVRRSYQGGGSSSPFRATARRSSMAYLTLTKGCHGFFSIAWPKGQFFSLPKKEILIERSIGIFNKNNWSQTLLPNHYSLISASTNSRV